MTEQIGISRVCSFWNDLMDSHCKLLETIEIDFHKEAVRFDRLRGIIVRARGRTRRLLINFQELHQGSCERLINYLSSWEKIEFIEFRFSSDLEDFSFLELISSMMRLGPRIDFVTRDLQRYKDLIFKPTLQLC